MTLGGSEPSSFIHRASFESDFDMSLESARFDNIDTLSQILPLKVYQNLNLDEI